MKHLPLNNFEFEKLLKDFDQMVKSKGYKRNGYYSSCAREFLFFMESSKIRDIKEVDAIDIIAYHEYLIERPNQRREGGLSQAAITRHIFSLRLLFDYLLDTGTLTASPVRLPKFNKASYKERNIATIEEIKQTYSACENKFDKAILGLAYGCGLRKSEIYELTTSDIDYHKGALIVRCGKFGKTRTIPVSDGVLKDLKDYLITERSQRLQRNPNPAIGLFLINSYGKEIKDNKALNDRLKYLIGKTNNLQLIEKKITLHCLRHSISTHLLDNGASIEFVQRFLGHVMLDTTHIYSKRRKLRQVMQEAIYREQIIQNQVSE